MPKKDPKYYIKHSKFLGWGEEQKLDQERTQLLKEFVVGNKVLDIGCGYGGYVDYLISLGYQAYGVDFAPEFINKSKKNKKGEFVLGQVEKLPFRDKEFDTTLLFDILEHGDDIKILNEAKRVTSKRILVIVPRKVDSDLEQSGVIFRHYLDKSHQREYLKEDLYKLSVVGRLKINYFKPIHPLKCETVFFSLINGPLILRKILRKIFYLLLPKKIYPTELFVVYDL